jgi:two-component sensor histidine kinase/putative methionine-R-sulfoxide reductase with GAF domain
MAGSGRQGWADYTAKGFGGITLWELVAIAAMIGGAHALAGYNYLLFHTSVELFSVCIAFSIFIVGASAHAIGSNNFIIIAGGTYLFVAILDVLHTFSYKGMPFLNDYEYYGPQFWIAARYLEAAGLLAGIWSVDAPRRFNALAIFALFFAITAALTLSILTFRTFPVCFVPGAGLTAFKVYSEYAIVGLYATSLWVLHKKRSAFSGRIYELLRLSIVLMALMEVCFTFYRSDAMSDFFNELGHLIKIVSFYVLCKAFVIGSLRDPLTLVSRGLRESEELQRANATRLGEILDLQRDIASSNLNYSALLQFILERMTNALACDGACLEISDDDEMVYEAATGLASGFVGLRVKTEASLSGLSMTGDAILRADDTETDPRVDRLACRRIGLRSMIVMPLRYNERSFGVLKLMSSHASAFTQDAEHTLHLMQEFLGVTIARRRAQAALQESEEHIRMLLREVNHRSKNMLAVVQAIARQTVASSPDDFLARFSERIRSLATAQDLLIKNEWKGVEVGELVRSQLSHLSDLVGERITLDGPALFLTAPASETIGMALHELATNAGKYGALSNGEGGVRIEWRLLQSGQPEDAFSIAWTESGGPAVHAPKRQGFGSTVIGKLAEMKLGAKVDLRFDGAGLSWRLDCAAEAVLQRDT